MSTSSTVSRRPVEADDVVRFVVIDDAQINPDGSTVAYTVRRSILDENRYASAIYLVPTDGGTPRQITTGDKLDGSPRWSPDGGMLAFVSNRNGAPQIYLLDLAGGEARQLTTLDRGASSPAWSPDGSRIAFLSSEGYGIDDETRNKPGGFIRRVNRLDYRFNEADYIDDRYSQVWIVDVASGAAKQLTAGETSVISFAWSPDGETIAFTANRDDQVNGSFRSQLYVLPVSAAGSVGDNDGARRISNGSENALGPVWSPDGNLIAFVGRHPDARAGANNDVYVVAPDGEELRAITAGWDRSPLTASFGDTWSPRDSRPLAWTADGSGVTFTASDRGQVGLYQAGLDGEVSLVTGGERSIANVTVSADGQRLAFIAGSFTNPCDVYTCRADGSDERQLTRVNGDLLDELAIQSPEHMPFESFDGKYQLDAWIIRPVGVASDTKAPLVQIIHGGAHSIFGHTFFFDMQLWASQGWNVLFMNPRASQGYGEEFATGAIADWGGVDWREQEQALDLAIERGGIDPDRLAVTGLSYGGFMTNWIIGQTDRYKVAASENGICNLVSFFGTADIGWYFLEHEMEKPIWENLDWYMRHSPIWYVEKMTTPLLLLQAEMDFRCPIEQGEQLFTALASRGVPTEMVRFPGENHAQLSNGKPETRLVRRQVTLEWFKRYL